MLFPLFGIVEAKTYDREKAVAYARKYVKPNANGEHYPKYYNPSYTIYYRFDCANFASQVLHIGGIPFSSDPPPDVNYATHRSTYYYFLKYWYHTRSNDGLIFDTRTWSSVNHLYERLTSGYEDIEIVPLASLQNGDLIFFDLLKDGVMDHVGIVTDVTNGSLYYTAHTADRDNVSLNDFLRSSRVKKYNLYYIHIEYSPPDSSINMLEESNADIEEEEVFVEQETTIVDEPVVVEADSPVEDDGYSRCELDLSLLSSVNFSFDRSDCSNGLSLSISSVSVYRQISGTWTVGDTWRGTGTYSMNPFSPSYIIFNQHYSGGSGHKSCGIGEFETDSGSFDLTRRLEEFSGTILSQNLSVNHYPRGGEFPCSNLGTINIEWVAHFPPIFIGGFIYIWNLITKLS